MPGDGGHGNSWYVVCGAVRVVAAAPDATRTPEVFSLLTLAEEGARFFPPPALRVRVVCCVRSGPSAHNELLGA